LEYVLNVNQARSEDAEVKSASDKVGKSQERWIRDNKERLRFPLKLVEALKKFDNGEPETRELRGSPGGASGNGYIGVRGS
jgi:hypothetical protein